MAGETAHPRLQFIIYMYYSRCIYMTDNVRGTPAPSQGPYPIPYPPSQRTKGTKTWTRPQRIRHNTPSASRPPPEPTPPLTWLRHSYGLITKRKTRHKPQGRRVVACRQSGPRGLRISLIYLLIDASGAATDRGWQDFSPGLLVKAAKGACTWCPGILPPPDGGGSAGGKKGGKLGRGPGL